jgi:predicted MFS family arabinose efflux permease
VAAIWTSLMPGSGPLSRALWALGFTQIVCWGAIYYAISVLARPIAADTGWSATVVFAGFSLSLLVAGLSAAPLGRLVDRAGGRRAMTLGSAAGAAGLALVGLAPDVPVYFAGWAVLGAASRLTLYDAAFATLVEIDGRGARRAISVLTLFGGLASSIFWPLTQIVEQAIGWRGTFLAYAVLALGCAALHWLALPPKPAAAPGPADAADGASPDEGSIPAQERPLAIALLTVSLALNGIVFTALSAHMIPMFVALGLALTTTVWIASVKGVFQTLGRLAELVFGARLPPTLLAVIATGALPLAFLALAPGVGLGTALLFSIFYGVSNGLVTIVRGALPLVLFGRAGYAGVLARIAAPGLFLNAAAPTAFAALIEAAGPVAGLVTLFVLSLASFVGTLVLAARYR